MPVEPLARRWPSVAAALALTAGALAALVEGTPSRAAEPPDFARFVEDAVAFHVRPAHERFAQRTELLVHGMERLCESPAQAPLDEARSAFAGAVEALAALEPLRYGPILAEHRLERLAFWPDARGLALRQVQKVLADEDASATDPATLAGKSVGVQGLTALEFVLHGTGREELAAPGSFRCAYGLAIARNVDGIARELAADWERDDGAAALFTRTGPDNPLFRDPAEAAGEIIAGMAGAMEVVADHKLRPVLGEEPAKARPKLAPFWRSGLAFAGIRSTLEATQHLFEVSGAEDLLDPDQAWLGNSILFELSNAQKTVAALRQPVDVVVSDPAARDAAKYLAVATSSLKRAIGREFTAAVGLEQGFNALDGD